jgi:hypothetical protein
MAESVLRLYAWIEQLSFSTWLRETGSLWGFPMFLYLHTLGMSIVAGGAAVISIAVLGLWPKKVPIRPLERFYPVVWFGFAIELVTGIGMFMKDATTYGRNPDFYWKLVFMFAGVAILVLMRRRVFRNPQLDAGPVPRQAKMLAAASLLCWFATIVTGRLIAYLNPIPDFFG